MCLLITHVADAAIQTRVVYHSGAPILFSPVEVRVLNLICQFRSLLYVTSWLINKGLDSKFVFCLQNVCSFSLHLICHDYLVLDTMLYHNNQNFQTFFIISKIKLLLLVILVQKINRRFMLWKTKMTVQDKWQYQSKVKTFDPGKWSLTQHNREVRSGAPKWKTSPVCHLQPSLVKKKNWEWKKHGPLGSQIYLDFIKISIGIMMMTIKPF